MAHQLATAKIWDGSVWVDAAGGSQTLDIDVLVVAGGAGAGGWNTGSDGRASGGGGGGGFIETTISVATGVPIPIVVGAGGAGGIGDADRGSFGVDSLFGSIYAGRAGGGGSGTSDRQQTSGHFGVSGGGGGAFAGDPDGLKGLAFPILTATQGYNGGQGNSSGTNNNNTGGGGGGASAVGGNATDSLSGVGGAGAIATVISSTQATTYSVGEVSGSDVYFSGGGAGGACDVGKPNTGGLGGGADGSQDQAGIDADANTGGGGGGGGERTSGVGGSGGSGVVIFSVPSSQTVTFSAGVTTPNTYTDGDNTIYIVKATSTADETVTIG